jgi:hypothetical protein
MKNTVTNVVIGGLVSTLACGVAFAAIGQSAIDVPSINVSEPNRILPVKADDVCKVDFENIRVFGENRGYTAQLKDGKYKHRLDSGYEAVSLDHVFCVEPRDGNARHAIIVLSWLDCGGSCTSTGVVQLIAVRAAHAVIKQQFVFDSHATGTGAAFDGKTRTLKITGRTQDDSPNCCARNLDVVTYQWGKNKFVQQSYKRIPALSN